MSGEDREAPSELEPGVRIGAWRVVSTLGHGGMSDVFAVVDDHSGLRGALKMLHREDAQRSMAAERFAFEARVLRDLHHRGVPDIFELGQYADGRPYLVMELLEGMTLAEAMREGPPARSFSLAILEQLANVLTAAHAAGVVHRDIKPANIILVDADQLTVKLVDWGIAKRFDDHAPRMHLTTSGEVVGTPRYLAPEQARSEPVDAKTDVYTLGLVAYELLLGEYPFDADNVGDALVMQMTKPPPSPRRYWPEIPASLDRVLLAMLAKDPLLRPALPIVLDAIRDARGGDFDQRGALVSRPIKALDQGHGEDEVASGERTTSRCRPLHRE